jgi:electron transport complex protein RnfE
MASKEVTSTDEFVKGLWRDNPVFVQVLGMCPALAVSNTAMNALAMGLATTFVLLAAGLSVSLLRNFIPREARIVCYICIIATFVTSVDYLIMAMSLELHRALGAFIALIVVNCLILGRAEAFASKNKPGRAMLDGLGMGVGFTFALLFIGVVREILGSGSIFGYAVFPDTFQTWTIMVLPSGGFFAMALWLLIVNRIKQKQIDAEKAVEGVTT